MLEVSTSPEEPERAPVVPPLKGGVDGVVSTGVVLDDGGVVVVDGRGGVVVDVGAGLDVVGSTELNTGGTNVMLVTRGGLLGVGAALLSSDNRLSCWVCRAEWPSSIATEESATSARASAFLASATRPACSAKVAVRKSCLTKAAASTERAWSE